MNNIEMISIMIVCIHSSIVCIITIQIRREFWNRNMFMVHKKLLLHENVRKNALLLYGPKRNIIIAKMLLNLKNLASKGLCNTICPWMWSILGAGSTRPNCSSLMHLCPAVLFCSSALLLSTEDSQPPFQFLLRLAIAARSEQLGCQSAISCLVPTCEIIFRDCATNILLCCNYFTG